MRCWPRKKAIWPKRQEIAMVFPAIFVSVVPELAVVGAVGAAAGVVTAKAER
jgi:hypothetical protein